MVPKPAVNVKMVFLEMVKNVLISTSALKILARQMLNVQIPSEVSAVLVKPVLLVMGSRVKILTSASLGSVIPMQHAQMWRVLTHVLVSKGD